MKTPTYWHNTGLISTALLPISFLYRAVSMLDLSLKNARAQSLNVPVISIGNLTAGGSGKTPVVVALARYFTEKGETVAILSRGYGAQIQTPRKVKLSDSVQEVGDEPLMMAHMLQDDVAIWVSPQRIQAGKAAIAGGATLILLDDGFQHMALKRDIDVVCIKSLGNGRTIPSGPLREPVGALKRADLILWTGEDSFPTETTHMHVSSETYVPQGKANTHFIAFCALGTPEAFYQSLRQAGIQLTQTISFADHATYSAADEAELIQKAEATGARLITTEKDAVKLSHNMRQHCLIAEQHLNPAHIKALGDKLHQALKSFV